MELQFAVVPITNCAVSAHNFQAYNPFNSCPFYASQQHCFIANLVSYFHILTILSFLLNFFSSGIPVSLLPHFYANWNTSENDDCFAFFYNVKL